MPFIVEQVQSDGSIVEDYDQTISVKKLYERIQRYFRRSIMMKMA